MCVFVGVRKSFIVDKYSLVAVDGNCYVPICMFHLNTCADRSSRETAEQQQQATASIQTDTELVYKYTFKPHCVFSSIFLHDVWINSVRALTISSHISTQVVAQCIERWCVLRVYSRRHRPIPTGQWSKPRRMNSNKNNQNEHEMSTTQNEHHKWEKKNENNNNTVYIQSKISSKTMLTTMSIFNAQMNGERWEQK